MSESEIEKINPQPLPFEKKASVWGNHTALTTSLPT
jgi:hypothetical protein